MDGQLVPLAAPYRANDLDRPLTCFSEPCLLTRVRRRAGRP